jgi:UDP-N-acetylmuramyl pentapeptide phosphotransferase/UDP-N-acetylglucosamine-1-phosphate transferase
VLTLRWLGGALVAAATTTAVRSRLGRTPPGGAERWVRTNHQGEPVSLLEGPAVAAGLVLGTLAAAGSARSRLGHTTATVGALVFGLVDDLGEDTSTRSKGLRGHLGAALRGDLTTGALKVLGIGATGVLAAALAPPREPGSTARRAVDLVVDGAVVAGAANLVNLLDLRPGRALKAGSAAALVLSTTGTTAGSGPAGAVLGAAAAASPADLAGHDMLGDSGANALGALLGSAVVQGTSRPVRATVLLVLVCLTLASERVSFSQVIARTPWLDAVDRWGRAPAASPAEPADRAAGTADKPATAGEGQPPAVTDGSPRP